MSKRTIKETTTHEFSFDNPNEQLRKKIKLLNDKIIERIKEIDEDIDINEHEFRKFLLIFHSLFEIVTSEETFEETDGFLNDAILAVCNIIAGFLRNNIDGLKLPAILKTALKSISMGVKVKTGEPEVQTEEIKENAEDSIQTKKTNRPSREGTEEQR